MSDPVDRIRDIIDGHCGGDTLAQIAAVLGYGDSDSPPVVPASEQLCQLFEALKPFAEIGRFLFALDLPDDTPVVDIDGLHGPAGALTRGHFKAAARAYDAPMMARDGEAVAVGEVVPAFSGRATTRVEVRVDQSALNALSVGTKLYAAKPASAQACPPVAWPGMSDLEYAIEQLRETGNYRDEEGEATDALEDLLKALKAGATPPADARDGELAALRAFANDVIGEREQFDPDIQDLAEQHGLLAIVPVTESCGGNCECAEVGFPAECYRKTSILLPADSAMGGE